MARRFAATTVDGLRRMLHDTPRRIYAAVVTPAFALVLGLVYSQLGLLGAAAFLALLMLLLVRLYGTCEHRPESSVASPTLVFSPAPVAREFIGREEELGRLLAGFREPLSAVIFIGGPGGKGKTYLAARLFELISCDREAFWVDCGKRDITLESLLWALDAVAAQDDALSAIVRDPTRPEDQRIDALLEMLERGTYALFLDDYHKVKDRAGVDAFIRRVDQICGRTKLVVVARRRPAVLDTLASPTTARVEISLRGLSPSESQQYLLSHGLSVDNATAAQVWEKAGRGDPTALKIFAAKARMHSIGWLMDQLPLYDDEKGEEWLQSILADLTVEEQQFTSSMSVFRAPATHEAAAHVWGTPGTYRLMERLLSWYLLEPQDGDSYLVHDLVKDYCYRKMLTDAARREYHSRAGEFYLDRAVSAEIGESHLLHKLEAHPHHVAQSGEVQYLLEAHFHHLAGNEFDTGAQILAEIRRAGLIDVGLLENLASGYSKEMVSRQSWMWICMIKGAVHGMRGEWQRAKAEYVQMLDTATEVGQPDAMGDAHLEIGWADYFLGDLDGTMLHFEANRRIREQESADRVELARSYDCLGYVYHLTGGRETAERLHLECKKICDEMAETPIEKLVVLSYCHHNLGLVSHARERWEDAIRFYEHSLDFKEQSGEIVGQATTYDNLGNVYQAKRDWQEAIHCYEKSIQIRDTITSSAGISRAYTNLGSAYCLMPDVRENGAVGAVGDRVILATTYENLGHCYAAVGDRIQAGRAHDKSARLLALG